MLVQRPLHPIAMSSIGKREPYQQPCLQEHIQGTIDRCTADVRISEL
jgi:hypothetical protein